MVWTPPLLGVGTEGSAAYRRRKQSRHLGLDVPSQKPYNPSLAQATRWAFDPLRAQQTLPTSPQELGHLRHLEKAYLQNLAQ